MAVAAACFEHSTPVTAPARGSCRSQRRATGTRCAGRSPRRTAWGAPFMSPSPHPAHGRAELLHPRRAVHAPPPLTPRPPPPPPPHCTPGPRPHPPRPRTARPAPAPAARAPAARRLRRQVLDKLHETLVPQHQVEGVGGGAHVQHPALVVVRLPGQAGGRAGSGER